jgi:hypothetical protein
MENERGGGPERARLPGFEEPGEPRRPAYSWYASHNPPPGYPWPMGYARADGVRSSRRASTWTAAALIAGVAATTGYLAHAIPGTGTSSGGATTTHPPGKSTTTAPSTPVVAPPVTTSGGSGAAGGGGGGD